MTKYPPRLTNVFKLVALLAELDRRSDTVDCVPGMQLTLCYIQQLFHRHWDHTKVGWPIHLDILYRLHARYNVPGVVSYVIGNDYPEDDFLTDAIRLLDRHFKIADAHGSAPGRYWITTGISLQSLVRDQLYRIRYDDNWLQEKLSAEASKVDQSREFFNIWTASDTLIKQSNLCPEIPNEEKL